MCMYMCVCESRITNSIEASARDSDVCLRVKILMGGAQMEATQ
jgi:hypothetical protein